MLTCSSGWGDMWLIQTRGSGSQHAQPQAGCPSRAGRCLLSIMGGRRLPYGCSYVEPSPESKGTTEEKGQHLLSLEGLGA